jgi:hypothetical protein
MQQFLHVCLLLGSVSTFVSCSTPAVRVETLSHAQWKARTVIKDLKAKKTHIVRMDVVAQRPNQLRVDFTGSLGIYLGALAMNEKEFKVVIVNQKTVYRGRSELVNLPQEIPLSVSPMQLLNIFFEDEPKDSSWNCSRDKNGLLVQCDGRDNDLKISWSQRQGARRRIVILGFQKEIQLDISGVESIDKPTPQAFQLPTPQGYLVRDI